MTAPATGPVERAHAAWSKGGKPVPDWVMVLARECAASSQSKVAARMRRSASLVSYVLRNEYPGDVDAVEEIVRGLFMSAHVACPALGEIPSNDCNQWQAESQRFDPSNGLKISMFHACRRCPRNRKVQKEGTPNV